MNPKNKYGNNRLKGSTVNESDYDFEVFVSNLKTPSGKPKEQVWQAILEKIEEKPSVRTIPLTRIILRVAASVIILIGIGSSIWIWGFGEIAVYCPKGHHITETLPDSSKIQMNADTKISYNKVLWFITRKVHMRGEALFRVKRGKQFDVVTDFATTTVLGTTFDVYSRDGKVKVSCIEGKVSVKSNESGSKVILTAGLHTQVVKKELTKPSETVRHEDFSWTNGEFYFNNTPLTDVFKEIERQFNIEIVFNSNENRFYTGYFKNNDLNDALRLVCIPMDLSYSINNKTIEIKVKK